MLGAREESYSRLVVVVRVASGISGRVRDDDAAAATRFSSARRAHLEMLVNWRRKRQDEERGREGRKGRPPRARGKGGGGPREQKEEERHGRPSISRPVLRRSFPSAGKKSTVPGRARAAAAAGVGGSGGGDVGGGAGTHESPAT